MQSLQITECCLFEELDGSRSAQCNEIDFRGEEEGAMLCNQQRATDGGERQKAQAAFLMLFDDAVVKGQARSRRKGAGGKNDKGRERVDDVECEEAAEISISIPTRSCRIITQGKEDGGDTTTRGKETGGVVREGER